MRKLFYSLLILSVCFTVSYAEFFYLKSGKVVNGKIVAEADDSITVSVSGTGVKRKIMLYDIDEITKTPRSVPVVAVKTEVTANPEEAKTQFTSDLKQDKVEGDTTYVKDNKSGVLVFNVQETVVEKPKAIPESKPAANGEEFDAALFLLGNSASNNVSPAPVATVEKPKKETVQKPAKNPKTTPAPANNEEFDAALFLLSGETPAPDPLAEKQIEKETLKAQNDYYYDPAVFLLEDQSMTQTQNPANNEVAVKSSKKKDKQEPKVKKQKTVNEKVVSEKPDNETFLAASFDLKGVNVFSGEAKVNNNTIDADKTESTDYGISLSAEQYGYVSRFAAIGLGIGFQFKRCLEESPGRFGFLPLYGAFKMRFISEERYHFYAVAHLGYNFLLANSDYLDKSETNGGLYYAGGLGASYNKYVFQVLYSVNNASIKYSNSFAGDKVDKDVMYSKVGFYIGYLL